MDIRRRIKVKRFWIFGILLGICVTAASLYYFFQAEKKEAENRMVKTVNYVKVQCSTYTPVSYTHLEPSEFYLKATKIGGALFALFGIIMIMLPFILE